MNYVGQLLKSNGKPKLQKELKKEFNSEGQLQLIYNQILHYNPNFLEKMRLSENIKDFMKFIVWTN